MIMPVGFFSELGSAPHYVGSLRDAVSSEPRADEDKLVEYLRSGNPVLDVPDTTADVLGGDERIVGASSLLSDGKWIWRLDLAHYVAKYHLELPLLFVEHARGREYRMRPLTSEEQSELRASIGEFF